MHTTTFLVIDDSYIDRLVSAMLIKRTFETENVYEVSGGELGLKWLNDNWSRSQDRLIILLDIMMPQMNGFQFLDQFSKLDDSIRKSISIVMLSSTLDDDDILRANRHGDVKKLLSKPLSANELKVYI